MKLQVIFHKPLNSCQMLMNLTQYHPGAGFGGQEVKSFQVYDTAGHTLCSLERRLIFWGRRKACHQSILGHWGRGTIHPSVLFCKCLLPVGLWCFVKTNEWQTSASPSADSCQRRQAGLICIQLIYMENNPPALFEYPGLKCQPWKGWWEWMVA